MDAVLFVAEVNERNRRDARDRERKRERKREEKKGAKCRNK